MVAYFIIGTATPGGYRASRRDSHSGPTASAGIVINNLLLIHASIAMNARIAQGKLTGFLPKLAAFFWLEPVAPIQPDNTRIAVYGKYHGKTMLGGRSIAMR
jgi:hypothetical protein